MKLKDSRLFRQSSAILVFLISSGYGIVLSSQNPAYGVMSFNIRYDNPDDGINCWSNRKGYVTDIVNWYRPDVCGMQEVLSSQLEELKRTLPEYGVVGVGRNDGKTEGEFCPVLYKKSRFSLMEQQTFWLSENPSVPGKSWDAALPRIVTWAKLWDKITQSEFYVFNTHFDHVGVKARSESARLLHQKIGEIAGINTFVVVGDFNLPPVAEPITFLSQQYKDAYQASIKRPFGPFSTFNGFQTAEVQDKRIDYIFLPLFASVQRYATLSHSWNGRFASDHHPVYCEFHTVK